MQQLHQRHRHGLLQLIQKPQAAGAQQFINLVRQSFADAGQFAQLARTPQRARLLPHLLQIFRRLAIRQRFENHLALDFQQIGNQCEDGCEIAIGKQRANYNAALPAGALPAAALLDSALPHR